MSPYRIFIIDDEKTVRQGIAFNLKNTYQLETFSSAEPALTAIEKDSPDMVLLDIGLPGMSGIEALTEIKKIDSHILVIMITAFEDLNTVISAMKLGAHDYVVKPIQMQTLKVAIKNALETIKLRKEIQTLQESYISENMPCFIGESNAIQDVMKFVKKVAKSPDTPILIMGESGTGKELIAAAIHYKSPNFKGPFVSLNCAAIPKDLVESELFGYEKGAFSGANPSGKTGLIEQASDGTLFLDEVGDLSLDAQAKLLRFLEEAAFYRVGGTQKLQARTRIVSATNKDLNTMTEEGLFRLDLYYRLAVIQIKLPSLNERPDDILPIARYFLNEFSAKHGQNFQAISLPAEQFLTSHRWQGNIRELKNLIERGVLVGDGPELSLQDLGDNLAGCARDIPSQNILTNQQFPPLPTDGIDLEALEKHYIKQAYRRAGGNDSEAARLLKMNYYAFRYRKKKLDDL